jgi:hypothetical protein
VEVLLREPFIPPHVTMAGGFQKGTTLIKAQKDAMKNLQWLVGKWEGEGWVGTNSTERSWSISSENVQSKLDGLVLLVEGTHYQKGEGGQNTVALKALGIISYDAQSSQFKFHSYTHQGQEGDFEAMLIDKKFRWIMQMPQQTIRYTIELTEDDRWFEIGEVSTDGTSWKKFFEMNLKRL